MPVLNLPSQLAALADGQRTFSVQADTLGEAFDRLDDAAPMIRSQLFDAAGNVRQFIGLFVDNNHVLTLGDGSKPLRPDSSVVIVMAVAGG